MFTTVHSVLEIVLLRLLTLTGILAAKTAKLHADAANAGLKSGLATWAVCADRQPRRSWRCDSKRTMWLT